MLSVPGRRPTDRLIRRHKDQENAAANAVADCLAVLSRTEMTPRKWDDGTDNGRHDFYIEGDGYKIAPGEE
jgi:hypothetical protein